MRSHHWYHLTAVALGWTVTAVLVNPAPLALAAMPPRDVVQSTVTPGSIPATNAHLSPGNTDRAKSQTRQDAIPNADDLTSTFDATVLPSGDAYLGTGATSIGGLRLYKFSIPDGNVLASTALQTQAVDEEGRPYTQMLYPGVIAVTAPTGRAFVGCGGICVVDSASLTMTAMVDIKANVEDLTATPDGARVVAVALPWSTEPHLKPGILTVMDAATLEVQQQFTIGASPRNVVVSSDGQWAYVALANGTIEWVNLPSQTVTARTTIDGGIVNKWSKPLALAPDGSTLYFGRTRPASIVSIDVGTTATRSSWPVATGAYGLGVSSDGARLVVMGRSPKILDAHSGEVIADFGDSGRDFLGYARVSVSESSPWAAIAASGHALLLLDTRSAHPGPVSHIKTDLTGGRLTVSWKAPREGYPRDFTYRVTAPFGECTTTSQSCVIKIRPGDRGSLEVTARNTAGTGAAAKSKPVSAPHTSTSGPSRPNPSSATPSSDARYPVVRWSAPATAPPWSSFQVNVSIGSAKAHKCVFQGLLTDAAITKVWDSWMIPVTVTRRATFTIRTQDPGLAQFELRCDSGRWGRAGSTAVTGASM